MRAMTRRAFAARVLAATTAAAVGSRAGAAAETTAPTGSADPAVTLPPLAELDTAVGRPRIPSSVPVPVAESPFRDVSGPGGAHVREVRRIDERTYLLHVWSPANERTLRVGIMVPPPELGPRPTLYCLDGYQDFSREGEDALASDWYWSGGGHEFFGDKNLNVVFTVDPGPTMYRDFLVPVPGRGPVRLETFLAVELPPLVDAACRGNGTNGLMGVSSGAAAAFMTAVRHRGRYTTLAGFSGVYDVANAFGAALWSGMWRMKGIEPEWVMGVGLTDQWLRYDPGLRHNGNLQSLRETTVYLSAAGGLAPGEPWSRTRWNADPTLFGGTLEVTSFHATTRFAHLLSTEGVDVTEDYRLSGTHDWPLWREQLPLAWPTLARGLGVRG